MDQTDQTTQPITSNTSAQTATVVEKKHLSTLWVLLGLILIALVLAYIVSVTSATVDNTVPAPYTESTSVPQAGENPDATAEESAAIRSDLEMNTFDGTSQGI